MGGGIIKLRNLKQKKKTRKQNTVLKEKYTSKNLDIQGGLPT